MGGSGSTRWNYDWKKTTVEECRILPISILKEGIYHVEKHHRAWSGNVSWSCRGEKTGDISYLITYENQNPQLKLSYRVGNTKEEMDYKIALTSTQLYWGARRWWFICPLIRNGIRCNRRVGKLYLPPGGTYFGCRHCYDLTYTSCQESHYYDSFYSSLAVEMGFSLQEAKEALNSLERRMISQETQDIIGRRLAEIEETKRKKREKLSRYLTKDELSRLSGLSLEEIDKLESYRLLMPDTKNGRYRPRLVGWSKKLKNKLIIGWTYEEIKEWTRERWI